MLKFFMLIFVSICLSGCSVDSKQWAEAETKCKNNEGVAYVWYDGPGSISAKCNNKAKFDLKFMP